MADQETEDEGPDLSVWYTAERTMADARTSKGDFASKVLMERLLGGFLTAVALNTSKSIGNGRPYLLSGAQRVPAEFWPHRDSDDFWRTGDVHFSVPERRGVGPTTHWRCCELRFDPATIKEMFPVPDPRVVASVGRFGGVSEEPGMPSSPTGFTAHAVPEALPAPIAKHAGGRPRKEFWDDLWIAMFRRLWAENWQPKSQTEIENAMLDWATANGHDLGPTSVKTPAKKLYLLIKE